MVSHTDLHGDYNATGDWKRSYKDHLLERKTIQDPAAVQNGVNWSVSNQSTLIYEFIWLWVRELRFVLSRFRDLAFIRISNIHRRLTGSKAKEVTHVM